MQNVGISLCRMWEFHYAECGNFIKQNVWISLSRLCFSGIKPQCMSLKKAKAMIYNQAQNIILGISKNRFLV